MITFKQIIIDETHFSTISKLVYQDEIFGFILEDGRREVKEKGWTRIPAGRYELIPRKHGKFFARYRQMWGHSFAIELKDVPNFTDILVHTGNKISDTRGCLLINEKMAFDRENRSYRGESSHKAYKAFYDILKEVYGGGEQAFIQVIREIRI